MAKLRPKRGMPPDERPEGLFLGRYGGGDFALPVVLGNVILPFDYLKQHLVIIGKTGWGKTYTVWKILHEYAFAMPNAQFFFLDGAADPVMSRFFCEAMVASGRTVGVFPQQRFNIWPHDDNWFAVFNRLMRAIAFAETGAATYYRDASVVALARACRMGRPPRSTEEVLKRLNYKKLRTHYGKEALRGLEQEHVDAMHMRVLSLYEHTGDALDGVISGRDVDAMYFGLDSLVMGESVGVIAHMLLSYIAYYAKYEKDPERPCVVVIDEFAALSGIRDVAAFIEQVRKLGVHVILITQTVAGMGDFAQAQRMVNSVGLVFAHSTPEWKALSALIGTEYAPEVTLRYGEDGVPELDRIRRVEAPKVKPQDLLGLDVGDVYGLRSDKAIRFKVASPDVGLYVPFEFPEQEELYVPFRYEVEGKEREKNPAKPGYVDDGDDDAPPAPFRVSDFKVPADRFAGDADDEPAEGEFETEEGPEAEDGDEPAEDEGPSDED